MFSRFRTAVTESQEQEKNLTAKQNPAYQALMQVLMPMTQDSNKLPKQMQMAITLGMQFLKNQSEETINGIIDGARVLVSSYDKRYAENKRLDNAIYNDHTVSDDDSGTVNLR